VISDDIWSRLEPLIVERYPATHHTGRSRLADRQVLTGILFVLSTGISWAHLPKELGCGSGMTCWRRLREWNDNGVWAELCRTLADELQGANRIDWARARLDPSEPAPRRRARPQL
jgi:transposase